MHRDAADSYVRRTAIAMWAALVTTALVLIIGGTLSVTAVLRADGYETAEQTAIAASHDATSAVTRLEAQVKNATTDYQSDYKAFGQAAIANAFDGATNDLPTMRAKMDDDQSAASSAKSELTRASGVMGASAGKLVLAQMNTVQALNLRFWTLAISIPAFAISLIVLALLFFSASKARAMVALQRRPLPPTTATA